MSPKHQAMRRNMPHPLVENKSIAQQLFKTVKIGETFQKGYIKQWRRFCVRVRLEKRG
jgi:hypothetical protein